MEVIKSLSEFKLKRASGSFYSRPGLVITNGNIHLGVQTLLWKLVKNSDLRMVFLAPAPNVDYVQWRRDLNLEQVIADLKIYNLDFLLVLNPAEFDFYKVTDFGFTPNLGWIDLLESTLSKLLIPNYLAFLVRTFNLFEPKYLYMGQKDFFEAKLIANFVSQFDFKTNLEVVETKRSQLGIAFSANNFKISDNAKDQLMVLSRTLDFIKRMNNNGDNSIIDLKKLATEFMASFDLFKLTRLDFLDAYDLNPIDTIEEDPVLVYIEGTIEGYHFSDNIIL